MFLAPNVNIKARTGDAVHVRELVLNLAELGNKVSLVAGYSPKPEDELKPLLNHPNINITFNKNLFKVRFPRRKDISTISTCLKVARKNPPDIIYERCFSCKIGTILSKLLRKPLVVEVNGLVDEEAKLQGRLANYRFTNSIRTRFRRFFFESASMIVAVSQGIKEELQRKYCISPDKIAVIPNGANTELFRPMDQKIVKNELGLSHEHKYVCFVGNLAPWQGVECLIKAAPVVLEKVPEARFLIVGDGMMRSELENMVKKHGLWNDFTFLGNVPYESVPKYINVSDVCVVPKKIIKSGYSPLKLYEYMACSKPVIATRTLGFEILEKYNAGILINPEVAHDFANAVIKLLSNKKLIEIMGKNGMKVVSKNFSWEITAKNVAKICQKVSKSDNIE